VIDVIQQEAHRATSTARRCRAGRRQRTGLLPEATLFTVARAPRWCGLLVLLRGQNNRHLGGD